jgi:hypothetical protein
MIALLIAAVLAAPPALPPLPVEPDLPTGKLERWIAREGLSELEADQVRHLTNVWVKAFREYEGRVAEEIDSPIDEAEALPEGSDERHAKALEIHAAYSAKVARQKDLVKRIRKLVKLRGEWPESHPDEL